MSAITRPTRTAIAACLILGLAACDTDFSSLDFDLRGNAGGTLDTAGAARAATAARPEPDANGLITYPNYQVVVARRGDTVTSIADRIGMRPDELARFNGRSRDETLRADEVLALPRIISGDTGARPDIGAIAGAAIERADTGTTTPATPDVQQGEEPIRHRVARGETAFSVARLYGVSPRALAEWNGLSPDLAVREGQHLIIPLVIRSETAAAPDPETAAPGAGTATPVPPSATSALPEPITAAPLPASPGLDASRVETTPVTPAPAAPTATAGDPPALRTPVDGSVLRPYSRRLEGIDFAASAGSPVRAAAAGEVAAITRSTDQVPILVLRHADNLLTVYANIADLTVDKGERVRAGQTIAKVGPGEPPFLHFEVRRGFEAIDPTPLLD